MPPVKSRFLTIFQLVFPAALALSILRAPGDACALSALALKLWFERMIPSLFPFMVLSGLIVRLRLGRLLSLPVHPFLDRLYRIDRTMSAVLSIGFLFGFPLGAKTAAEAYSLGQLSKPQAQFLLTFCNNIGPVYLLGFALPFLGISGETPAFKAAVILVFFGLPLLYGLILRHTVYRAFSFRPEDFKPNRARKPAFASRSGKRPAAGSRAAALSACQNEEKPAFIPALDDAVTSACAAITRLGGYMIFFIVCNLPFSQMKSLFGPLPPVFPALIAPVLEITSGLALSKDALPTALCMTLLTFGGLSCFAQTYTCIRDTDLSFPNYCFHKLLQTAIALCLYALLFSVFSGKPLTLP